MSVFQPRGQRRELRYFSNAALEKPLNTNMLRKTSFKLFKRRIRLHVLSRLSPKVTFSRCQAASKGGGKEYTVLFRFVLFSE